MTKTRLLLTGFEPFGERTINSSWDFIRDIPGRHGGFEVRTALLPVVHKTARRALDPVIAGFRPQIIIGFGEFPGDHFALERVAVNLADFPGRADNAGRAVAETRIDKKGPAAFFSTLPLARIHAALAKHNIPVQYSLSAGTYLCNEIFYHIMLRAAKKRGIAAGFIHVPRLPEKRGALHKKLKDVYGRDPLAAILSAL